MTRWRVETDMASKWLAYALLEAERGFRKIHHYEDMAQLAQILEKLSILTPKLLLSTNPDLKPETTSTCFNNGRDIPFTYRGDAIRIIGAGYWRIKEGNYMKSKIKYTDEPMGELKVVSDFLPRPHELVFEEDTVKVTIGLSRSSVDFFKREAKRNHTAYQKMIRRLLDVYASRYEHGVPISR